jgi:hypothetical protein
MPQKSEKFIDLMQLMKLEKAANLLSCGTDELLHLGATGRLEVVAPVVAEGEFSWPPDIMASGLIEFDAPIVRYFDASSRIMLFPSDVAKIEAVGWTIPWRFYSPFHSQKSIDQAPRSFEDSLIERHEKRERAASSFAERFSDIDKLLLEMKPDVDSATNSLIDIPGSLEFDRAGIEYLRKTALDLSWTMVEPFDENSERTTVEHLFISRQEFFRLRDGSPQTMPVPTVELSSTPPKPIHGNTERHSKNRFEVLFAAIWSYRNEIEKLVGTTEKWTEMVEIVSRSVWGEDCTPIRHITIKELLDDVLDEKGPEIRKIKKLS